MILDFGARTKQRNLVHNSLSDMHLIDSIEEKKLYHNRRRLPDAQYDTSAGTHIANSARMLLAADRDFLYLIFQMVQ